MDNPNAARNCPACRKNVDNREDAIGHSQKCIELIGGQEQWIKGRKNEDSPPTPHSNGAVAHEVSAQSSDDGVESRPSCPDCGKVFKVLLEFYMTDLDLHYNITISDSLCAEKAQMQEEGRREWSCFPNRVGSIHTAHPRSRFKSLVKCSTGVTAAGCCRIFWG